MTLIASINYNKGYGARNGGLYDSLIPLTGIDVQANIIDNCGTCTVKQKYRNNYSSTIEAIYLFNLACGDVVSSMSLIIGDRVLKSSITERTEAREIYNEAKSDGLTTCLLEQLPNNSFKMNVGNLEPGVEVVVEFTYLTVTVCENDSFRFVLPTNIAPRYESSSLSTEDMLSSKASGALSRSVSAAYPFNISVRWVSVNAITGVESTTNELIVTPIGDGGNQVHISSSTAPKNGDFSLTVRAAFAPAVYAHTEPEGADQSSYLMVNHRIPAEESGTATPKEYIFVLDRSGSMGSRCDNWSGALRSSTGGPTVNALTKMGQALAAVKLFMESLPPNSTFNVVSFGNKHTALYDKSVPYTNANKAACLEAVSKFSADMGGTEILSCLVDVLEGNSIRTSDNVQPNAAARLAARRWVPGQASSGAAVPAVGTKLEKIVVLLTDGQVNNSGAVIDLCKRFDHLCRVFCVGIGAEVDRHLVEGVARASNGQAEVMSDAADIDSVVVRMLDATSKVYYTDVNVKFVEEGDGCIGAPSIPSRNYARALYPGSVMSVFAKCPAVALNKLSGVTITARDGTTGAPVSWQLARPAEAPPNQSSVAIKQLYASDLISPASRDRRGITNKEAVHLSMECHVMSDLTSFVVVDTSCVQSPGVATVQVPQYNRAGIGGKCWSSGPPPGGRGGRGGGGRVLHALAQVLPASTSRSKCKKSNGGPIFESVLMSDMANIQECAISTKADLSAHSQELSALNHPPQATCGGFFGFLDGHTRGSKSSGVGSDYLFAAAPPPPPGAALIAKPRPQHATGMAESVNIPFNVDALLPIRNTDGSFEYAGETEMLAAAHCSPAQFRSLQAQIGASVSVKLLFNMLVMVQLEALQVTKYVLILRNLKAWVARMYSEAEAAFGPMMSLEQAVVKIGVELQYSQ